MGMRIPFCRVRRKRRMTLERKRKTTKFPMVDTIRTRKMMPGKRPREVSEEERRESPLMHGRPF